MPLLLKTSSPFFINTAGSVHCFTTQPAINSNSSVLFSFTRKNSESWNVESVYHDVLKFSEHRLYFDLLLITASKTFLCKRQTIRQLFQQLYPYQISTL